MMAGRRRKQLLVERDVAANYVLLSVAAFGATVVLVRLFLELTGYPQVGNSTLHIAHMLWGGLLLFVGLLLVLIWDNPSALTAAAILGGIGIGLFIDEVGKFITQNNDYFFPAAAPIIYGFFLLTVLLYLFIRRPDEDEPRRAMILALEDLQDAVYGELSEREVEKLSSYLITAQRSERTEISEMAALLHNYVSSGKVPFRNYEETISARVNRIGAEWASRLGRGRHRALILAGIAILIISALLAILVLAWVGVVGPDVSNATLEMLAGESLAGLQAGATVQVVHILLEVGVGVIAILALYYLLRGKEARGTILAMISVVLSLTAVQLLTFYLEQFTAVIPTLYQFGMLLLLLSYRRLYLTPRLRLESVGPATGSPAQTSTPEGEGAGV